MPQLEMVPENVKVVERGKYEDVKTGDAVRSRHTSVVSSGPSVSVGSRREAARALQSEPLALRRCHSVPTRCRDQS